jgi:hypothetical protein
MRAEGLLRFENGKRRAKSWHLVAEPGNQFPRAPRGITARRRDSRERPAA